MPPKPKCTKEEIIEAAYRIMESGGFDSIAARDVGRELGTTTSPIFTYFENMDELKNEVYLMAQKKCAEYLRESLAYVPTFKEFGLRWVRFSKEHSNAYELLFLRKQSEGEHWDYINTDFIDVIDPMIHELMKIFSLSQEQADKLVKDMCIFAQGIASAIVNNGVEFHEERIGEALSRVCISSVIGYRIQDGTLNQEQAKLWLTHLKDVPRKK